MDIYSKIKKKIKNVPFGNSIFQIEHFSRGLETPERTYRNCLLQINQKLKALKECEFRRRRMEIDIKEIKQKLETAEGFEKERLLIDLEEKQFYLDEEIKLIEDCIIEIKTYERILDQLPDFTREEFENAERKYWEKKLLDDARREAIAYGTVKPETMQSLEQINIWICKNQNGEISYLKKEDNNDNILCIDETNSNRKKITNT